MVQIAPSNSNGIGSARVPQLLEVAEGEVGRMDPGRRGAHLDSSSLAVDKRGILT